MSERRKTKPNLIGVIADTHGLLRPEAVAALQGVDLILHAGDIGSPEVLERLRTIAPVIAIRGNVDKGDWARELTARETIQVGGVFIYMLHDLKELEIDPARAGFRVVVSGHSHKPLVEERAGVLYVNPGGAGARRFKLPLGVALLTVNGDAVGARLIELLV